MSFKLANNIFVLYFVLLSSISINASIISGSSNLFDDCDDSSSLLSGSNGVASYSSLSSPSSSSSSSSSFSPLSCFSHNKVVYDINEDLYRKSIKVAINSNDDINSVLGENVNIGQSKFYVKVTNLDHINLSLIKEKFGKSLLGIDLSGVKMDESMVSKIVESKILSNITHLDLSNTFLRGKLLSKIVSGIGNKLTHLCLANNYIGKEGIDIISNLLIDDNYNILSLNISGNALHGDGIAALSDISSVSKIVKLNIARNDIGQQNILYVKKILSNSKYLSSLNLSANNIRVKGLSLLLETLVSADSCLLSYLNLDMNRLSMGGFEAIVNVLDQLKVENLSIKYNNIGLLKSSSNSSGKNKWLRMPKLFNAKNKNSLDLFLLKMNNKKKMSNQLRFIKEIDMRFNRISNEYVTKINNLNNKDITITVVDKFKQPK